MNLYVISQGGVVTKQGDRIVVQRGQETLSDRLVTEIENLIVFGSVQISTQALLFMLDKGVSISLMTENGHFRGQVRSSLGKNVTLRFAQFERSKDNVFTLAFTKAIVAAKIENAISVLYRYHRNPHNPAEIPELDDIRKHLAVSGSARTIDSCRGYEGIAAKAYFSAFARCLTKDMGFAGREFYPSKDPVNALLSFGYSFVSRELQSLMEANDLDPFIGFFHQIKYGRASLACDLTEEFRPLIDRIVLKIFNLGVLDADDFYTSSTDGGCYLKKEALSIFVKFYEDKIGARTSQAASFAIGDNEVCGGLDMRTIFKRQIERLCRAITHNEPYEPYKDNEVDSKF